MALDHHHRVPPTDGQVRRKPLRLKGFLSRPGGQERNFTPLTDLDISESILSDGVRPSPRNPLLTRWVSLSSTLVKCRIPWGARDTASLVHLPESDGGGLFLGPGGGFPLGGRLRGLQLPQKIQQETYARKKVSKSGHVHGQRAPPPPWGGTKQNPPSGGVPDGGFVSWWAWGQRVVSRSTRMLSVPFSSNSVIYASIRWASSA